MPSDLVERLRASVTQCRAVDRSELLEEAAAEIERLRLTCPYVTGRTTQYCTLTPFSLTDAEREAVEASFDAMQYAADELGLSQADCDWMVATLRGLLERLK
jgi:hypothetical protein